MNELSPFRLSSRAIRRTLACSLLLALSGAVYAADYPENQPPHHLKASPGTEKVVASARVALFERNDAQRAMSLATREVARNPRSVDGWFILMEASALLGRAGQEADAAISVCKLASISDPRANVASRRLSHFDLDSNPLTMRRDAVEGLAAGDSACAGAAFEALYEASLHGPANVDNRQLARSAGWLTKYTIARRVASNARPAEQFEFADARIVLPDYLPRNATYSAKATFTVATTADYRLSGDLEGVQIWIDEMPAKADLTLASGSHDLTLVFSAAEATPRARITPVPQTDETRWTSLHLAARETTYLRAAVLLDSDKLNDAAQMIRSSELAGSSIGQNLVTEAARLSAGSARTDNEAAHTNCVVPTACGPDSLDFARSLMARNRHEEAIRELRLVLHEWPLDRNAHRLLISELQQVGDNRGADRAAAQLLEIAPNARNFRRMAQTASDGGTNSEPFYREYQRPAPLAVAALEQNAPALILLQDKVAITRPDGSVSLYMHRVVQLLTEDGVAQFHPLSIPAGSRVLSARVMNAGRDLSSPLQMGDEIEEEYVVNYTGDGGLVSHPEAFQYVFNDFDFPLLDARFIVLSPAAESPGYVIASGHVPESRLEYRNGFRAQIWERQMTSANAMLSDPAIVRVVENENGWSIPPSVERRRILETIHPGPRPREA